MWTKDLFNYHRRRSSMVHVGQLTLGGDAPIRIQSMANTNTNDTEASVKQAQRIIDAGGELVRFTAQGTREASNLENIRKGLSALGEKYAQVPLVADIHFMPAAADVAALYVEKVRINPGNYVDKARTFVHLDYTDEEYAAELQKIKERFVPFLQLCKEHHRAIRIGVNHGSLSDRIMSRYGDTPAGMVESCMEFLRICVEEAFMDVVISIKASNTVVMIQTVRLLVETMEKENMSFPLHLGVTEAGDGEDGRIKSAVGIGALLADGIGDTIRVSLSEAPEKEIPVAQALVDYIRLRVNHPHITPPADYEKWTMNCKTTNQPIVIGGKNAYNGLVPDYYYEDGHCTDQNGSELPIIEMDTEKVFLPANQSTILLSTKHPNPVGAFRAVIVQLRSGGCMQPIVLHIKSQAPTTAAMQLQTAADTGVLFIDGMADGLFIEHTASNAQQCVDTAFGILQAARVRTSKTEYISCPGCGRTMFNLEKTITLIKKETSHLTGLKIGIMGCIVNGPGEMADADYGYVGAGRGKISLYKKKECIEKNIPEEEAVEHLIKLIKQHNDWKEK